MTKKKNTYHPSVTGTQAFGQLIFCYCPPRQLISGYEKAQDLREHIWKPIDAIRESFTSNW